MTPEQREKLQAIWSVKISSEAEFLEKLKAHHAVMSTPRLVALDGSLRLPELHDLYTRVVDPENGVILLPNTKGREAHFGGAKLINNDWPWWLSRDVIRQIVGVYEEPTSVQKWLRSGATMLGWQFIHTARGNPENIAFNVDQRGAIEDRKLTTTIGRYMRKYLPNASDAFIAALEAQHRSELDDTFLVATSIEDIELVYTQMAGDTGCMRYQKSQFHNKQYHPSAVYSGPGLGVAYLRNSAGQVCARSVIYDNPDDNTDKRYVRIYGDSVLAAKLKRNGYRCAGLRGAKFPALIDPAKKDTGYFVMPYLDPAGGRNSAEDPEFDGLWVMKYKDEDFLRVIGQEETTKLYEKNLEQYYVSAQDTCGYKQGPKVFDPAAFMRTCAITGESFDTLNSSSIFVYKDGKVVEALTKNIADGGFTFEALYGEHSRQRSRVRMTQADYEARTKDGWVVNKWSCEYQGWAIPDPEFYPERATLPLRDQIWSRYSSGVSHKLNADGNLEETEYSVLKDDEAYVFKDGINYVTVHKDYIAQLVATGEYVPTLTYHGKLAAALKTNTRLGMNKRKQYVVAGAHPYGIDFAGRVVSSRLLTEVVVGSHSQHSISADISQVSQEDFDRLATLVFNEHKMQAAHDYEYYCRRGHRTTKEYRVWRDAGVKTSIAKPRTAVFGFTITPEAGLAERSSYFAYDSQNFPLEIEQAGRLDGLPLRGENSLTSLFGSEIKGFLQGLRAWAVKGIIAARNEFIDSESENEQFIERTVEDFQLRLALKTRLTDRRIFRDEFIGGFEGHDLYEAIYNRIRTAYENAPVPTPAAAIPAVPVAPEANPAVHVDGWIPD